MKRNLLRFISILILLTIVATQRSGLRVEAARQASRSAAPTEQVLGRTTRISVANDGSQGNRASQYPSISDDGRYVVFESQASNLVDEDTYDAWDIFVYDRQSGSTERVSISTDGDQGYRDSLHPSISVDGRFVAFSSLSNNLVKGDTNWNKDVFVHDRQNDSTERVSVASDGSQGNSDSFWPSISADGRYVAFDSWANNLVSEDINDRGDIFVHDRQTGSTELISVSSNGEQGDGDSSGSSISSDGRYVAFSSWASNLVIGDTNHCYDDSCDDVFVHDRLTGTTERVSISTDGIEGNYFSYGSSISTDGRFVAFISWADNLVIGDTNDAWDVFVHDRQTGETTRISVASNGSEGNDDSYAPTIVDGRYVVFVSDASNLVGSDTNDFCDTDGGGVLDDNCPDVFLHNRQTGITERVSLANDSSQGNGRSFWPSISANGRFVVFDSFASNLVSGDTNNFCDTDSDGFYGENCPDVFVRDREGRIFVFYLPVAQNRP